MHAKVQEVIYYGESQCQQALNDMSKANIQHQAWMQCSLQQELVCIFSLEFSPVDLLPAHSHVICWNHNLSWPGH